MTGLSPTARCGALLRSLSSDDDYEQCLELQRLTWGNEFRELVPPTVLKISQKIGGVLAGAFEDGQLLAFVYGISGIREGVRAHWSHMLAVVPKHQGRGLGRDLKLYQRQLLQSLKVEQMYWTFDPLIARNANLNLQSLGARPVEYAKDLYGADTGSEVHSGLGTDRFIVRWSLGTETPPAREAVPMIPTVAKPTGSGFQTDGCSWIEIPADIDAVKDANPDLARAWRARTRKALMESLDRGDVCRGLLQRKADSLDGEPRFFYVFEREGGSRS